MSLPSESYGTIYKTIITQGPAPVVSELSDINSPAIAGPLNSLQDYRNPTHGWWEPSDGNPSTITTSQLNVKATNGALMYIGNISTATEGFSLTWNKIQSGQGNMEILVSKGASPTGGRANFYVGLTDDVPATSSNLAFSVQPSTLVAHSFPIAPPSRTLLGNFSGTATGPNASATLTTGGSSNIAVVPGGVYCLQGQYALEAAAAGTDFGFQLYVNNQGVDSDILAGASSAPYKTGGALKAVPLSYGITFVPTSSNVQLAVSNGNGAGAADYVQANLTAPELVRIR